ncbi:MAG: PEP-CTERM sorting domain-containing protein [Planctomycetia bacterium]|nr:PEP-CTERM sorting domain-containing protein [Planctomycetia bacterium]
MSKVDLDLENTIYTANDTIAPNITIGKAGTLKFNRSDDVKYIVNLTTETSGTAWAGRIYNPTVDTDFISAKLVKDGTGKLTLTFSEDSAVETFARSFSDENATNNAVFLNADLEIANGTLEIQTLNTKINGIGIRGDITGSGTLLHTQNTKLDLFGDNREFTGTLRSSSPAWLEPYRACSISAKAIYDITGANGIAFCSEGAETFHFGALVGNDSNTRITRSGTSSGTPTVKVGGPTQLVSDMDNVFAGKFDGNLNLVKAGPGTWTLTGTSTHTGTTTVEGGVLRLTSTAQFTSSNVTVNADAGLNLEGKISKDLTLNGDLVIDFTNGSLNDVGTVYGSVLFGKGASISVLSDGLTTDEMFMASYELTANSVTFVEGLNWDALGASLAESSSNLWLLTAVGNGFTVSLNHNAVPEPATWVMLLGGAVGIVFLRRKSRKI